MPANNAMILPVEAKARLAAARKLQTGSGASIAISVSGTAFHLCLGATLARLETTIAVHQLLERLPTLERDRSQPLKRRAAAFAAKHEPERARADRARAIQLNPELATRP